MKILKELITINKYGRIVIKANITEEQLLALDDKKQEEAVLEILQDAIPLHQGNATRCIYLKNYLYGDQDIYRNKEKYTRKEINNKTVENWAYAMVDFKKTYLLGKPIQYVQLNDSGEQEISDLNKYCRFEKKQAKDMMIYEDILACGRGFRFIDTSKAFDTGDSETPFQIINCPTENTEVVYSSKLGNEQLLSFIKTEMQNIATVIDEKTGEPKTETKTYQEYTVYLRNKVLVYSNKSGSLKVLRDQTKPLLTKTHRITEYYVNPKRISLIELGIDLFNDINYLESMDKDDMEQFVNAIMVFTNAEIDEDGLKDMKSLGAVCINSTDNKKASIDLLQGRLNATDTQTYYTRLLTALHQILGIPRATDTGTITSGDTGKAKLTGQGFTSSGIRIEGDECMFGMCDTESLKCLLEICRTSTMSSIKKLHASECDRVFQRDMTDNILIKTQALQNLYSCDIPRKFANSIIGLFGDANSVTKEQERLFGEQTSQTGAGKEKQEEKENKDEEGFEEKENDSKLNSNLNETQKQNNNIQDTLENQKQNN